MNEVDMLREVVEDLFHPRLVPHVLLVLLDVGVPLAVAVIRGGPEPLAGPPGEHVHVESMGVEVRREGHGRGHAVEIGVAAVLGLIRTAEIDEPRRTGVLDDERAEQQRVEDIHDCV